MYLGAQVLPMPHRELGSEPFWSTSGSSKRSPPRVQTTPGQRHAGLSLLCRCPNPKPMGVQHLHVYSGTSASIRSRLPPAAPRARHLGYKRSLQNMQVYHYYACMNALNLHVSHHLGLVSTLNVPDTAAAPSTYMPRTVM